MTDEHPNAAIARRLYERFAARDYDGLRDVFTADAVWHIPGRSPIAGDYRGVDKVVDEFLAHVVGQSDGTLRATPLDLLANDRRVIVLQHSAGTRKDRTLDITVCQVFNIREGKIAEVTTHYSDLYALDAFWSD